MSYNERYLRTVNGGTVLDTGIAITTELLGPGYSTHRTFMVAVYEMCEDKKIELIYEGNSVAIFRFRGPQDLQHYWSTHMSTQKALDSKYRQLTEYAIRVYDKFVQKTK